MTLLVLLAIAIVVCVLVYVVGRIEMKPPVRNLIYIATAVLLLCLLIWLVAANTGAFGVLHQRV